MNFRVVVINGNYLGKSPCRMRLPDLVSRGQSREDGMEVFPAPSPWVLKDKHGYLTPSSNSGKD
jgi:hypothetical protein